MAIASAPALACSFSTLSMLVASISASRASIASINSVGIAHRFVLRDRGVDALEA